MKKIIILLTLFVLTISVNYAQAHKKYLKETTGFERDHKITGWVKDTTWNENGSYTIVYKAKISIIREGGDGNYTHEVSKALFENNDATIDWLWQQPEFNNFIKLRE